MRPWDQVSNSGESIKWALGIKSMGLDEKGNWSEGGQVWAGGLEDQVIWSRGSSYNVWEIKSWVIEINSVS